MKKQVLFFSAILIASCVLFTSCPEIGERVALNPLENSTSTDEGTGTDEDSSTENGANTEEGTNLEEDSSTEEGTSPPSPPPPPEEGTSPPPPPPPTPSPPPPPPPDDGILRISTKEDLINFAFAVNGETLDDLIIAPQSFEGESILLLDSIDLGNDNTFSSIGTVNTPFKGNFDGNGYIISNMTVTGSDNVGLFGYVDGATIENIGIEDSTITGEDKVGSLIGYANDSVVSGAYAKGGTVTGDSSVGGLIGAANDTTISQVYNTASVSGIDDIAGIVGNVASGTLSYAYNTGALHGERPIGGIIGESSDNTTMQFIYNTGTIISTYTFGSGAAYGLSNTANQRAGIIGNILGGRITNAYNTGIIQDGGYQLLGDYGTLLGSIQPPSGSHLYQGVGSNKSASQGATPITPSTTTSEYINYLSVDNGDETKWSDGGNPSGTAHPTLSHFAN